MQKNKIQKPFFGKLRMFTPEKRNSYDDFTYFEVRDQQKENISKWLSIKILIYIIHLSYYLFYLVILIKSLLNY